LPEDEEVTAADRLIIDSPTRDRPDRAEGLGAGAGVDAAGAGLARGIALHVADRISAGQATRTGSARASFDPSSTGQALITAWSGMGGTPQAPDTKSRKQPHAK